MKTTLNKIRAHSPCEKGWEKLLRGLGKTKGDDEPLWIDQILDINGLDDALWCLDAVEGHDREIRLYAVWCARRVQHLMTDPRSVAALDVAERFARGEASGEELEQARMAAAAAAAAWAARSAWAVVLEKASSTKASSTVDAVTWAATAWSATTKGTQELKPLAKFNTERALQEKELRRICREMREANL
jgi:hypothetical protein